MKKIKIFIDKLFLNHIEKISPRLYRFFTLELNKVYSQLANYIKYGDKYYFHTVAIEISSYCNRKCSYCPNKDYETPKEYMSLDVFEHVIEELKQIKYTGIINYAFYGEPLFDNRLEDFIKYVRKHLPGAIQVLTSNGDILTEERALILSSAGIDKFIVTVHDQNPKRNLERLMPIKKILKHKMRLQTSNDLSLSNRAGLVDVSNEKSKKNFKECYIRAFVITRNGDVALCCNDYFRKHVMGNIMNESITDIWNSYKTLRENLLAHDKVDLDICKACLDVGDNDKVHIVIK